MAGRRPPGALTGQSGSRQPPRSAPPQRVGGTLRRGSRVGAGSSARPYRPGRAEITLLPGPRAPAAGRHHDDAEPACARPSRGTVTITPRHRAVGPGHRRSADGPGVRAALAEPGPDGPGSAAARTPPRSAHPAGTPPPNARGHPADTRTIDSVPLGPPHICGSTGQDPLCPATPRLHVRGPSPDVHTV
jgi:hypothetical protein